MNIWGESLSVMGIGLVMVFLGLFILIAFIYIINAVVAGKGEKGEEASAEVPAPAPFAGIDPQVVAVIAAAVAAMDANGKPLVIRSIRRSPGWKRASRAEQVYRF